MFPQDSLVVSISTVNYPTSIAEADDKSGSQLTFLNEEGKTVLE